jgi:hypothetical protein
MHVGHASPPPAIGGHGHRADNATARAMNAIVTGSAADGAEEGENAGSAAAGAATAKATPTAPLSQTNMAATIGAQSDAGDESSAAAVGAPGRSGETPAARARALIAENPGLADRPFGHIVSALARGLEVDLGLPDPVGTDGEEGTAAVAAVVDDEAGEETSDIVGETAESDVGPSAGADDGDASDVASTGDGEASTESGAVAPEDAGILPLPDVDLTVAESLEEQLLDLLDGDEEEIV